MTRNAFFSCFSVLCCLLLLCSTGMAAEAFSFIHSFSTSGTVQPANWRLKLEFNRPVSILEISKRISCRQNGKNSRIKVVNATTFDAEEQKKSLPPERKVFIIGPAEKNPATGTWEITVAKGIIAAESKEVIGNSTTINFSSTDAVTMSFLEPFFDSSDDKGVYFDLDDNVKDYKLARHVKITPPIGYFKVSRRYHSDRNRYRVVGKFVTGRKYTLQIIGGSVEGEKQVLANASQEFTAVGPQPQISFAVDRSVIELKSRQLVPLSFTRVGNFKCQLTKVPAFFGPALDSITAFAEAEEKRPQDSDAMRLAWSESIKIGSAAAELDSLMVSFVKQHEALKQIADPQVADTLKNFLTPDFSSEGKAFLGTENPDREHFFSLPLDYRSEPEKGGSVIVRAGEIDVEDGQRVTRLFQVTDLAITYKFGRNDLLLWVTSVETGRPVAEASIMLLDRNGLSIMAGKTDRDGIIRIDQNTEYPNISLDNDNPKVSRAKLQICDQIIAAAATPSDSCFIKLTTNRIYPSAIGQASPDMRGQLSANGNIFTERGVYRPGETVFWKTTVREYSDNNIIAPAGMKVTVSIKTSRSETIYEEEHELNEFGTCSGSVVIKSYQPLGQYNIKVTRDSDKSEVKDDKRDPAWDNLMGRAPQTAAKSGSNDDSTVMVCQTSFQVQEFEPPRHFVTLEMNREKRTVRHIVGKDSEQEYLVCKIKGNYYSGGPVRHAKVQWTAHLTERTSSPAGFNLYHFGNNDTQKELIESGNSVLSKDGELAIALPISNSVLNGLNSIEISATVLDVDARPSTAVSRFSPDPVYRVGIARLPSTLAQGEEFPVQIIAIDKNGQKLERGEIQLEIMRKRYFYIQKRNSDGGIYYSWTSGWTRSHNAKQSIKDGMATFDLILAEGGDYMLLATYGTGNEEAKAAMSFYVDYSYSSFEDYAGRDRMRSENEIFLMPDRDVAAVNDKIKIRYSLPRICEYALLTKESDGIINARVVKLDKAQGEFIETLTEAARPNVYIGLIAPATRGEFPLYVSDVDSNFPRAYYGYTNIKVQNSVDNISVAIAPEQTGELKAGPGDQQKISFVVTDRNGKPADVEMAVCVVDEAILSLTGYVTPSLNSLNDFLLPLSVFTGDLRTSLISQDLFRLISTRALTGGDGGAGAIASDLDSRKDFRPVAYWNAGLRTDANGRCEIEFKLPDSMTSYRIYAVALDRGTAFNSKDRQLKVSREFYLEPALPRFMTAGDKATLPVSVSNKGNQSGQAEVSVIEAANLAASPGKNSVNLEPFTNSVSKLTLEADNGAGEAKLVLSGSFNGLSDSISRTLPVNPAATIINRNLSGHFTGTQQIKPDMPKYLASMSQADIKGTVNGRLNISTTPWPRLAPALRYLMRYPYGCLEQVSSGIIPLAGMRNLVMEGRLPGYSLVDIDKFLEGGFNKLMKMQRASGGFSYWTSQYSESWWGTQYAVFAMTIAKKSGYAVDEDRLQAGVDFIRQCLFKNNNDDRFSDGILAMAVVNLAMNSKISAADMDTLKKRFEKAGKEAAPLMLWAEALNGQTPIAELQARLNKLEPAERDISYGWQYTPTRHNALLLLTCLTLKGNDKMADDLSGRLLNSLGNNGYWNSTADTGLALFALAEYFKSRNTEFANNVDFVLITADGKETLNSGQFGITREISKEVLLSPEGITIEGPGKILLSYSLEYSYPDETERTEAVNKGFSIEKKFENLSGSKDIRVGDIIKATVEFEDDFGKETWYGARLNHLAVEDPIPAGFIAINPDLKNDNIPSDADMANEEYYCDWEFGAYTFYADHRELRNDRLLAFKDRAWSGRFRLVYYLRAVCEGTFKMKPSQIGLMYNPEYYGMSVPQTITVLPAQ
ncbi:MAG: hypothetical protein GQF41_2145 [Candidatus Rifleibacterium amylolyticum]|nr:MAG: hypothetical protein GQF41_2145 [Candidatus Rifleibacterium amylolyticum]